MALLESIKDHHGERRLFVGRIILAIVVSIVLLGIVISRLVQLQILDQEQYTARAQGNRLKTEPVAPIRGLVLDRKGRVLAENLPSYQLELIPEQVEDIDDTLERLATLGLIDGESIDELKDASRQRQRFLPVTLNPRLSDEDIAQFAVNRPRFPGVDFRPRLVRHYPNGSAVAHAVGYVSALTTDDLENLDAARYAGTRQTGRIGVESRYEDFLHGDAGLRNSVTNARGRQIGSEASQDTGALPEDRLPEPGDDIRMTLDLELQLLATELMKDRRGAIVAMDPNNGDILALVSAPAFDPNLFSQGMTQAQFRDVTNNPDRPLFNRAVLGTYPPGSTIKPQLALAALETGATNLTRKTMCRGWYSLPGKEHRYRDWKPEGHGLIDLHGAVEQSCDVYFYEIANDIGINRMHDYLDRFGLGKRTGIDLNGERSGIVPSTEWKRNAFRNRGRDEQRWYDGETIIASIGQGYMTATPLQLAVATSAMATRGIVVQPRLVLATENPITGQQTNFDPVTLGDVGIDNEFYWDDIIASMYGVLHEFTGTAFATGRNAPYKMAGKSGTSQVISIGQDEEYNEEELEERLRDHALFVAFAPLDNPTITVSVIVENGSSGSTTAAPIARAIMDRYLGYDDASE